MYYIIITLPAGSIDGKMQLMRVYVKDIDILVRPYTPGTVLKSGTLPLPYISRDDTIFYSNGI